jgi:hypothetical protein
MRAKVQERWEIASALVQVEQREGHRRLGASYAPSPDPRCSFTLLTPNGGGPAHCGGYSTGYRAVAADIRTGGKLAGPGFGKCRGYGGRRVRAGRGGAH